ncbi:MAG: 3,4-dihydroxy-2-butanone-4-phosphate synthase [Candidatus Nanohaloarchaea archaeon]|nr:3,4-dihydroxy-2-butanone-4-phosphate synthase [Candidatus Nanohaloarchaea archaeon]
MGVEEAVESLEDGEPVLLYDMDGREEETDMVLPASETSWEDVRTLRNDAGGLVCAAIPRHAAESHGLPLLDDLYNGKEFHGGSPGYGSRSSFSVTVNHRSTYTGVTDRDRARTIRKLAEAVREPSSIDFSEEFRAPGHVHVLRAAENLLEDRQGHTELSLELMRRTTLPDAAVVTEMLDDGNGKALSREKAERYAERNGLVFLEGEDLL